MGFDRFAGIRFNDRPIAEPLRDQGSYILPAGEITADYEAKPAEGLKDLYPNIARFRTYPSERYRSREQMAAEWDRLWTKVWLVSGRASDIPKGGDWYRYDHG